MKLTDRDMDKKNLNKTNISIPSKVRNAKILLY